MTQARSIPLTEDELEQLEELLVSDEVPADCMNLEMLDGYLAAIVASPLPIPVEDWLPAVWTADEGEVGFGSGSTLQKAIELVLRYYNDQLAAIADEEGDEEGEAEGWQPFCYAQGGDDDPAIGEEWTNGFEQGFEMWPVEWPDKVSDTAIAMRSTVPISNLLSGRGWCFQECHQTGCYPKSSSGRTTPGSWASSSIPS